MTNALAEAIRSEVATPLRGVFYPLGLPIEITTNSPAILQAAEQSWGDHAPRYALPMLQVRVIASEDGDGLPPPPTPAWSMDGHMLYLDAGDGNYAVANMREGHGTIYVTRAATSNLLYLRYHFIESVVMILISSRHAMPLHSACVSFRGKGMLFWGAPGAGKTTLAYACARAGWTYTADDSCYVLHGATQGRVIGNARKVRFRPAAKALFPELQGYELTPRTEGKPSIEIPTAELPGLITSDEARVEYVIFLHRKPTDRAWLVPLGLDTTLQRFHTDFYDPAEIRTRQASILSSFANVKGFELHYETLTQAIDKLEQLANSGGSAR